MSPLNRRGVFWGGERKREKSKGTHTPDERKRKNVLQP